MTARICASARSITPAMAPAESAAGTATLAATRISSGPRCSVFMWMTRSMPGVASIAVLIASSSSGSAASPVSIDTISIAKKIAMMISKVPTAAAPIPSNAPLPVTTARVMPIRANTRPNRAPVSSSRMTGSSGLRVSLTNRPSDRLPRTLFVSFSAVRSEKLSKMIATKRTANAICGSLRSSGCWILWMPSYSENSPPTRNSTIATMKP